MKVLYSVLLVILLVFAKINPSISNTNNVKTEIYNDSSESRRYKPDWDDLDKRPLPKWYDEAKIGIFLHWGVYSVPGFGSEWFWYYWKGQKKPEFETFMNQTYPPNFSYQEFAPMFKADFFNPEEWATLFYTAGAKYVVLTTKHHEGFALFPSKRSYSWNSVDVGPKRDIVKELSAAVKREGLKFGVYHSLFEWFNPIYLEDKATGFKTQNYVNGKAWPDIKQLVNDYKPSIFWSDGDGEAYDTYWRSQELVAWLYNDSPVKDEIVVNDRWGMGTAGKHGDFYNYDDRYNPGKLLNHKWENAFTIDKRSWGWRRNLNIYEILSIKQLLYEVVSTISCGGNALINIGPTKEGTIDPIFQERLLQLGTWLKTNGEAIYSSSPWVAQNDSATDTTWYTSMKSPRKQDLGKVEKVYAIMLHWPESGVLKLKDITPYMNNIKPFILGMGEELKYEIHDDVTHITLPPRQIVKLDYAWTISFTMRH